MWIKICGICDPATALEAARLEADAIGLNFYGGTARAVSVATAAQIVARLPPEVEPVGVFVNATAEVVASAVRQCWLSRVQLHGDETPKELAGLIPVIGSCRIVRAFRLGPRGLAPLADDLRRLAALGATPAACLIDARVEGIYGGSGQTADWKLLAEEYDRDRWPPLILAGGLRAENVAEAIETVRPWGVDVASGVESAPGVKDPALIGRFIETARTAFAAIGATKTEN